MPKLPDDARFKHVDYKHTDLRLTFARIRREQAAAKAKAEADEAERGNKVRKLKGAKP